MNIVIKPYSSSSYANFYVEAEADYWSYSYDDGLSGGAIAGIIIGSIIFIAFIVGVSILQAYAKQKRMNEQRQAGQAALANMNAASATQVVQQEPMGIMIPNQQPQTDFVIAQGQPVQQPAMYAPIQPMIQPKFVDPNGGIYPGQPMMMPVMDPAMGGQMPYPAAPGGIYDQQMQAPAGYTYTATTSAQGVAQNVSQVQPAPQPVPSQAHNV